MSGERIRTLDEILADLEDVAKNFDKGWRAEPPTMAALVRRIIRELKESNARLDDERDYREREMEQLDHDGQL